MGTWKIVNKPLNVILIANKWVFVKKTDLMGEIIKHKARLVIKGCLQHPKFNFNGTCLPVVQIETVRILLAMIPTPGIPFEVLQIWS